jgi:hypothetical protein
VSIKKTYNILCLHFNTQVGYDEPEKLPIHKVLFRSPLLLDPFDPAVGAPVKPAESSE